MLAIALLSALLASPAQAWSSDNHTCALQPKIYSCENKTAVVDTCCTPTEGLVLTTQFWDTYTGLEAEGSVLPKSAWTIHGLWPDKCDGSYGQYCDLSRQYDPVPSPNTTTGLANGTVVPAWKGGDVITPLLNKYGKYDLLAYMNKYWKSQGAPDWTFWQHEFSKHATCFSTYDVGANGSPNCYGDLYQNATEASIIDFLESVIAAQIQYPTYQWLADAGILPSNQTAVNVTSMSAVLAAKSGAVPYIGCSGATKNAITEIWYYAHSLGRPQESVFKPLDATAYGSASNCNKTAPVYYYTRSTGSEK